MKPIIIYSSKSNGGIKQFAFALNHGFNSINHSSKVVIGLWSLIKLILTGNSRKYCLIASVEAGLLSIFFSKSIYVLHGFPAIYYYSYFKYSLLVLINKFSSKYSSTVVSVSFFTRDINSVFFKIESNYVIHNPVRKIFLDGSKLYSKSIYKAHQILYVGRLLEGKRVDRILEAFKLFHRQNRNFNLQIIGEGPLLPKLKASSVGFPVSFVGHVHDENELIKYYHESEIFISLNEFEPFGIVFLEAISSGLKIIAPSTGGHREIFSSDSHCFTIKNVNDIDEIANAFLCVSKMNQSNSPPFKLDNFSPENVALSYFNCFQFH